MNNNHVILELTADRDGDNHLVRMKDIYAVYLNEETKCYKVLANTWDKNKKSWTKICPDNKKYEQFKKLIDHKQNSS